MNDTLSFYLFHFVIQSDYILYSKDINRYTYELREIKLINILIIYKFLLDNLVFSDRGIKYMVAFLDKFRNTSAFI